MSATILRFPIERTSGFGPLEPLYESLQADDPWIVVGALRALYAAGHPVGKEERVELLGRARNREVEKLLWPRWTRKVSHEDDKEQQDYNVMTRHTCTYEGPPHPCPGCDEEEYERWVDRARRFVEREENRGYVELIRAA